MRPAPGPQPRPAAGDTSPAGSRPARTTNHVTVVKQFFNYLPNNLANSNSMCMFNNYVKVDLEISAPELELLFKTEKEL